jgi:hypothetical protein
MKLNLLVLLALPLVAFAASSEPEVRVNSFHMIAQAGSGAEICGVVLTPTGHPQMVKVVVDPNTRNPGSYYVWSGKDGKFCAVVSTFSGSAEASLDQ